MKNKRLLAALAILTATCAFAGEMASPAYPNFGLPRVEEMMFLVLQIGIIIFAAKLGGMLASLLKLPSILGELAAGILIGPWALGGIGIGDGMFRYGLFNGGALKMMNAVTGEAAIPMFGTTAGSGVMFDATSPALYGIATLASIILLFLSGLETNLKMFLRYSFVGSMVGVGGVIFSFLFGDICAVMLLPKFFPATFGHLSGMTFGQAMMQAAPMYMGIMSIATSVGITARILSERKKMDSEEGVTIMAGAVIDDVLGLIVLAIGNGIIAATIAAGKAGGEAAVGMPWGKIGMVAVKAFGVWVGATLIGVVTARKISWLLKLFKSPQAIATLAFGLSMILAGLFEFMGLAMIIGAYVMGLALSRTDLKHMIQETLAPVYTFLVPVFFCVMGMMVDVSALMSKPVLIFGGIYTILAILAKVLGCALPSWFCGFNFLGGMRIGAGMVPRGEVALIIAGLGLSNNYLSQEIFGIGILMTLVTTVIAPPALVGLFIPKRCGVRNPKPSMEGSRQIVFELPNAQLAEIMQRKLVVEFRHEGFFTIQLAVDSNMAIWEISMDASELSIHWEDREIRIECTPAEEVLVHQAWMEVISQMNELAHTLAKPIKKQRENMKTFLTSLDGKESTQTDSLSMRYVQGFLMIPRFRAYSKQEAIEKLIDEIAAANPKNVVDINKTKQAVFSREESMPTGLNFGIAVPHGRTDGVNHILGAVALVDNSENENGVIPDYETMDHSKIQIIVLTLVPESAQAPYLHLMAYISQILRSEDSRQELMSCTTPEAMRRFFRNAK
jgi:Kef-type K+ transport system membrane component KefB/mannitol/fructose-specific phosphotransferase system IIA component (Ntr-type)